MDNASDDDTETAARAHGFVRFQRNSANVGYARAMNQALADARADVLIALNPDTEPAPDSLATLTRRLWDDPTVGLVAPRLVNPDGTLQHSVYTFPSVAQALAVSLIPPRWQRGRVGRRLWLEGSSPHDVPADVDWVIGAVHVVRAEAVDQSRPYSERWFMYVEDLDLCWRLAEVGWRRRLEPDVEIMHVSGASAVQAYGSDRAQIWMPPSYDWYAETHGTARMRAWATVNTMGVAAHALFQTAAGMLGRRESAARARAAARLLPIHARAMLRRPHLP